MEGFVESIHSQIKELQLLIMDAETLFYGGNQEWFRKKFHRLSGCGPVAAANITAYLSKTFPHKFKSLYSYGDIIYKDDFTNHMVEIRKFVKPGPFGLTSVRQFANNTISFAENKGVSLISHILEDDTVSMEEALSFIYEGLHQGYPLAILVLTHSVKELEEYVWHWMTITDLKFNSDNKTFYITTSSYGVRHEINFNLLWNGRSAKDNIKLIYFT